MPTAAQPAPTRFELPRVPMTADCYQATILGTGTQGAAYQPAPRARPGRPYDGPELNAIVRRCLDEGGTTAEFEPIALEALRLNERDRGPTHDDTIAALRNLGEYYLGWEASNAERIFNRVVDIGLRLHGPHNAVSLRARGDIGRAYRSGGFRPRGRAYLSERV